MIAIDEPLLAMWLATMFLAGFILGRARRALQDRADEIIEEATQ